MKLLALILTTLSIPLAVFGWWGTSTTAGRARYDEMDGLYPLGAGVLAMGLIVASVILAIVARRLKMRRLNGKVTGFEVVQGCDGE